MRGGFLIASLALVAGIMTAAAWEMKAPHLSSSIVDWSMAAAEISAIDSSRPSEGKSDGTAALMAMLSRATGGRFAGIAASPIPVLLPFDTAAFLRDRAIRDDGAAGNAGPGDHLLGFERVSFFHAGPAGYDAVVVARARQLPEPSIGYSDPIHIHIGGSALLYELEEPTGMIGLPVKGLDDVPGARRVLLENYLRYTFVRYGVPYVVAIECFDGGSRFRKISCRDAEKVAVRFLKALRVVGGIPSGQVDAARIETIDRPAALSSVFTYHSPGNLLAGTGFKRKGGVADYTVYSRIRFPISDAPAFANSQSFMNWGNCEATGRLGMGMRGRTAAYRCRVNPQPLILDESAAQNYSYPWRDNFCEHRYFFVGQCPAGLGHQGQDIRPAFCRQRTPGANRCEPYQHDVVAVRDGMILRAHGQEALYILVNAPNERVRFRYLHMHPRQFDADGLVNGRFVREGEVIGKVGNYFKQERATTYHLHFDLQVPTRNGWVFVNPYMTLVAAYERLIHGRGQELREHELRGTDVAEPAIASTAARAALAAKPTGTPLDSPTRGKAESERTGDDPTADPADITASLSAPRHGGDGSEPAGSDAGQPAVRAVGHSPSRTGARPWHFRRHPHAGDGQHQDRHERF